MRSKYITSTCLRRYYSQLTLHCPSVTLKSRSEREFIKKQLYHQLSGKVIVKLEEIQVNNAQIYEKTSIKGPSPAENEVIGEYQQQNDVDEPKVEAPEAAHFIISHEPILQQQQQKQDEQQQLALSQYELDLTGTIDTHVTTVTTKTTTNLNLRANFELTPYQNNSQEVEEYDHKIQNAPNLNLSVLPAKSPTKVFVFNVPRAFTSCAFESPISFSLSSPEDMVQIIAPQVRKLLKRRTDDETLQATKILEQINDENGRLINEAPSTSKKAAKRRLSTTGSDSQPMAKKKRGRKPKLQKQQETEPISLAKFYENTGWLFEDQGATPRPCHDENTVMNVS